MTFGTWEIVGQKDHQLPLGTTLGDAFRALVTHRFKDKTAKHVERLWDIDAKTAKNIVQRGCVSERTLTKASLAEGWAFWMALGEQMFGQSYSEWEEERLTKIIEEAERDLERVRRLRPKTEALSAGAVAGDATGLLESGQGDLPAAGGEGGGGSRAARHGTAGARQ